MYLCSHWWCACCIFGPPWGPWDIGSRSSNDPHQSIWLELDWAVQGFSASNLWTVGSPCSRSLLRTRRLALRMTPNWNTCCTSWATLNGRSMDAGSLAGDTPTTVQKTTKSTNAFMEYLGTTMGSEIPQWCRIYHLEDIKVFNKIINEFMDYTIWCLTKATSIQRGEECSVLLYTCTHWQGTHEEAPEHASETTVEILENCWTYYVLNSSMNLMGLGNKNVHAICKEPCKQNQHKGQKHQQHSCNNCIKQYPSGCSLWWAKDSNCNSFSLNYGKHVFHFAILKSSLMSFNNRSRTFCIVLLQRRFTILL